MFFLIHMWRLWPSLLSAIHCLSIYDWSASVCLSVSEHFAIFLISQKLRGQVLPTLVKIILMEIEL